MNTASAAFVLGDGPRVVLQARRFDRGVWRLPIYTATFLSKLAVPPFGAAGISVAIPLICAASAGAVLTGRMVIDTRRMLAYVVLVAMLWAVQIAHSGIFSPSSMLLLTALHLPYVLRLRRVPDYERVLEFFQSVALVIAMLGLLQYVVQFAVGPKLAFPIENFFPEAFRVAAFNTQGYVTYGSNIFRTNGVFMLEPSFFSQFLAIGVVIELITRRRVWAMAAMFVGMLVSYSGTGLALLGACLVFLGVSQKRWVLLGSLAAAGVTVLTVAGLVGNVPYVSVFLARAGEFSSQGSSGFARFVGGFYMFDQFLWSDPVRALTGYGAGTFQQFSGRANYPVTGMALFKMVFEFGVVGAGIYFGFLWYCISRSAAPAVLRVAVGLCYLLSGNYIPFAHGLAFTLLIWTAPLPADRSTDVVAAA
jgi:hypothetical protein